ncbi:MAG: alpha/beta hydrolase [Terriglobia bacterium]
MSFFGPQRDERAARLLGKQLDFSVPLLQAVKVSFEKKFCRSLESLEAVNIIPQLQTPPLLIIHDKYDPVLPFHNAVDLARVWKNSGLLTTHGMGHVGNLDALTPINKVLDFLVAPGD